MLKIGCHLSAAKGYEHMGKDALKIGANTFAFFTRNPRGGKAKAIDEEDVKKLLTILKEHEFGKLVAHAPYTLNPCSKDEKVRNFAYMAMSEDMERMEYMEKDYMAAQYERAIAEDVMQLAGQYGYETADARVRLSESYEVAEIELWISETDVEDDGQTVGEIVIGEIVLGEGPGAGDTSEAAGGKNAGDTSGAAGGKNAGDTSGAGEHGELAREIASYYRVDPSVVRIH